MTTYRRRVAKEAREAAYRDVLRAVIARKLDHQGAWNAMRQACKRAHQFEKGELNER